MQVIVKASVLWHHEELGALLLTFRVGVGNPKVKSIGSIDTGLTVVYEDGTSEEFCGCPVRLWWGEIGESK